MKIVVLGWSGPVGLPPLRVLAAEGHDVRGLARSPEEIRRLAAAEVGAAPVGVPTAEGVAEALADTDALVILAAPEPVGYASRLPGAYRNADRSRIHAVRTAVAGAVAAGVGRIVLESSSLLYADGGEDWITESHPLGINAATEPLTVAEAHVQAYAAHGGVSVVLRLGTVIGATPVTEYLCRGARRGRPMLGDPSGWVHVVHSDDVPAALATALLVPGGVYNLGATPVRRGDLHQNCARGIRGGVQTGAIHAAGPVTRWLAGPRSEPQRRSLRVSSEAFSAASGWMPARVRVGSDWFEQQWDTAHV